MPTTDPNETKEQIRTHCGAIREAAGLPLTAGAREVPPPEAAALARQYGKDANDLAEEVVEMIRDCPEPFAGIPDLADRIFTDTQELARVVDAKDQVDALSADLEQRARTLRGHLLVNIDTALRTKDATLRNPATPAETRSALAAAARKPERRLQERNAAIIGRRFATMALKQDLGEQLQRTQDEASAKDLRISTLELENQYLAGEGLRPSDVVLPTTAPKEARRRGKAPAERTPPARPKRRRTPR